MGIVGMQAVGDRSVGYKQKEMKVSLPERMGLESN